MSYLILFIGMLFLLINYFRLRKASNSVVATHDSERYRNVFLLRYIVSLWGEWKLYALGNEGWRSRKGLITAIATILILLFINEYWLEFEFWLFLPSLVACAFIAQIRIGRELQRRYFENRFPEVLAIISAAISAGNSLHQALHRCGDNLDGELGLTFKQIDRRINLGEEPERVFRDAWQQYRYREFYFFVVVMLVSLQRGGQLRVLIGRLSRIIINSKNMARRKAAMTSEARMSAKIVAAIPLLFFIGMKYISPQNFDFIINDPTGRYILYYVIGSEFIGLGTIWMLVRRATR